MRPKGEGRRERGVKCSDEEAKKEEGEKNRMKREVGGEKKCSECLYAAQLEERIV
jgi:hypothetical protein